VLILQIASLLERLVPQNCKSFGCWKMSSSSINDAFDYTATLKHFLQVRFPATWWTSDSADGTSDGEDERGGLLDAVKGRKSYFIVFLGKAIQTVTSGLIEKGDS
jgi:hypothetical protein